MNHWPVQKSRQKSIELYAPDSDLSSEKSYPVLEQLGPVKYVMYVNNTTFNTHSM